VAFLCYFDLSKSKSTAKTTSDSSFDLIFRLFAPGFLLKSPLLALYLRPQNGSPIMVIIMTKISYPENTLDRLILSQNVKKRITVTMTFGSGLNLCSLEIEVRI